MQTKQKNKKKTYNLKIFFLRLFIKGRLFEVKRNQA